MGGLNIGGFLVVKKKGERQETFQEEQTARAKADEGRAF